MTGNWGAALSLAGLMVALFLWLRLDTRAALQDLGGRMDKLEAGLGGRMDKLEADLGGRMDKIEADLGGRMDKLEAGMKDLGDKVVALGERVARLEGKFELVEAYILRRNEPAEGAPAE